MKNKMIILGFLVVGFTLLISSCASQEVPECPECPGVECPEIECPECPEIEACPDPIEVIPEIEAAWIGSGHGDSDAEAFRHWDEDDPAVISTRCGKCHSTDGYVEFLDTGEVATEFPAFENMGIQCVACHNEATIGKNSVVMPSGVELIGLGDESRCMECHQGRNSLNSLNTSIAEAAGVEDATKADPDTVYDDLGFSNIHYYPAAASKYGTLAKGGGEYPGKFYDGNFAHVEEYDTCIECHDSHTLEVGSENCVDCHGEGDFTEYRMLASAVDYDGDSDIEEGIASEINGLAEILYSEIIEYSITNEDTIEVIYLGNYPYWGAADGESEVLWTPRLARAAYNYQMFAKDPGNFAHGGKYLIQLLYDSIEDLNEGAVMGLTRDDHGHFRGSADAFRHWDEDGEVSGSCSRCHSADGLPLWADEGVEISQDISNGFKCETCHGGGDWPARYAFTSVMFPSGATINIAEGDESGLCMQCHQGRESGVSVAKAVTDGLVDAAVVREEALADYEEKKAAGEEVEELPEEREPGHTVMPGTRFLNIHYFAAGATRYGTEAGGGYEYPDKEYVGMFAHVPGFDTCMSCHDAHELEVQTDACYSCHAGVNEVSDIRISIEDFDGDGDTAEGIAGEIETMREILYELIVAYPAQYDDVPDIQYVSHHPYWVDSEGGRYTSFTPTLLYASYNYQFASKDPGGFVHNSAYIIQLLYDSIEALGGDVSGKVRP